MDKETYFIEMRVRGRWKLGLHEYTKEEAEKRIRELENNLNVKCRLKRSSEIYS